MHRGLRNSEATLFALDDAVEKGEWGSVHMGVESVVHALTITLGSLHDVITPAGQADMSVLLALISFFMLLTHVFL
jgi:hypothetical protein